MEPINWGAPQASTHESTPQGDGTVSIDPQVCGAWEHDPITNTDLAIMIAALGAFDAISACEQVEPIARAKRDSEGGKDLRTWLGCALAQQGACAGCAEVKQRFGVLGGVRGASLEHTGGGH